MIVTFHHTCKVHGVEFLHDKQKFCFVTSSTFETSLDSIQFSDLRYSIFTYHVTSGLDTA